MNVRLQISRRITLAALIVLASVSPLVALPTTTARAAPTLGYHIEPAMTSSSESGQTALHASGSVIVWQDSRTGTPDVYAYDLADSREFRVGRSPAYRTDPSIDGSRVIWIEGANPLQRTITGYDLSQASPVIVTAKPGQVADPTISGDNVVWRQHTDRGWQVDVKNLVTGEISELPAASTSQANPVISGENVVWQAWVDGRWTLIQFNLKSSSSAVISSSNGDETDPALSGNDLVFLRSPQAGGPAQLIDRDLSTGHEQTIVSDHVVTQPSVSEGVIAWEDWRTGLPDIYAYDLKSQVMYAVVRSQQAFSPAVSERAIAWISRSDLMHGRVQAVSMVPRLPTDPQEPPAVPSPDNVYFTQTKHFMSAGFKTFWQSHGAAEILGYPLTEEFSETDPSSGEQITVQYLQRAKLEYRASAPEGTKITVARLGAILTADRHFARVDPVAESADLQYFPETGHTIAFGFKKFWAANGGLDAFGFPISEEFTENGRTVQYFERARFEFNPNSDNPDYKVTLGLLGQEALERMGWLPLPPVDTTELVP